MTQATSVPVEPISAASAPLATPTPRARLRLVAAHAHEWTLRETEYEDGGHVLRRFECACGAVDFS